MLAPRHLLLLATLAGGSLLQAQVSTPTSPVVRKGSSPRKEASSPQAPLTERARSFAQLHSEDNDDYIAWRRTLYRHITREQTANAPLFYPESRTAQEENLFSLLFRLFATGEVTAYAYQDGETLRDEASPLKFEDFLKRFHIPFTSQGAQGQPIVAPEDIPSALVQGYYLQEEHSFDERTSTLSTRPRALCPLLRSVGDYGQVNIPLFWVSFDELRPYLQAKRIPWSATNAVRRSSLDDFFTLQLYRGDIVKTDALGAAGRLDLASPETLQAERSQLERELQLFQDGLFLPDSVLRPLPPASSRAKKAPTSRRAPTTTPTPRRGRDKRVKPTQVSSPRPTSSGSRSVRDRG